MILRISKDNGLKMDKQSKIINLVEGEFMDNMDILGDLTNNRGVVIGAACRVQIGQRFFLLVELEIGSGQNQIERLLIFEISRALFNQLANRVELCTVLDELPNQTQGLELLCTFVVGNNAFIVFERENMRDRLIIVRSPLCDIIN